MSLETQLIQVFEKIGQDIGVLEKQNHYPFIQSLPSSEWIIVHNMGKFPSVSVLDSAGDEVEGFVKHLDINSLTITFSSAFSGKAFLN